MNTKWECVNLLWAPYKYERQYTIYIIQHPNSRACFNIKKLSYQYKTSHYKDKPGPRFNIKMLPHQYRKSHCGYKTVVRSSYLHNGISYTVKTASLYWIEALKIDDLAQDRSNSIANALELLQSCTDPLRWSYNLILKQGPGLPLGAQEFADIQLSMNKLASSNQPFPSSWPCIWRNV